MTITHNFELSDEQAMILETIAGFVEAEAAPNALHQLCSFVRFPLGSEVRDRPIDINDCVDFSQFGHSIRLILGVIGPVHWVRWGRAHV